MTGGPGGAATLLVETGLVFGREITGMLVPPAG